jgi:putative nucleotidyltransferase with HDIG domain
MDKRRRAERLVANLRWLAIIAGLAALAEGVPTARVAVLVGAIAVHNAVLLYFVADPARFARLGRRLAVAARVLDAAAVSVVLAISGDVGSPAYLLYWFPLVGCGYTNSSTRALLISTGAALTACTGATLYAHSVTGALTGLAGALALRSAAVILGFLVAAYIAKTRSEKELASERGSYLHAILDCGVRLTSLRSVHELSLYVLRSAVTETGAGGGELLLVNEETQELECEAFHSQSRSGQELPAPPDALLRSYANWVMSTGKEFTVRQGARTNEEMGAERDEHPAMAVPLLWQSSSSEQDSSVLGVLIVWGMPGEDFGEDAIDILGIFAAIAGAAIVNLRLYTNLQKSFLRTLHSLANGLEARDEYTRGHSERVMQVACMIAEELGVPSENIEALRNAAQLHDIGKIGVPDAILRKAGKLTADEWETMRRHPLVSEEICRPLGLAPEVLFLIKHHHERIDGKGYPAGLSPQDQPLLQRILVVADSFDAMRSRRPYRDRMPEEELIGELNRSAGRTMDPTVVDALRRIMCRGDIEPVYEQHDRAIEGVTRATRDSRAAA